MLDDQDNVVKMIEYSTDITDRKKAEKEKKTLKGIIPICTHFKGIRDDEGYWNQIELYISQHSEAQFSNSICDKYLKKYYQNLMVNNGVYRARQRSWILIVISIRPGTHLRDEP